MISSISNSHKYEWVLTTKGVPDMRLRKNRENMLHMAKELDRALVIERRKKGETESYVPLHNLHANLAIGALRSLNYYDLRCLVGPLAARTDHSRKLCACAHCHV